MFWQDEGYLLSKNNFDENSIIVDKIQLQTVGYNQGGHKEFSFGGQTLLKIFQIKRNA